MNLRDVHHVRLFEPEPPLHLLREAVRRRLEGLPQIRLRTDDDALTETLMVLYDRHLRDRPPLPFAHARRVALRTWPAFMGMTESGLDPGFHYVRHPAEEPDRWTLATLFTGKRKPPPPPVMWDLELLGGPWPEADPAASGLALFTICRDAGLAAGDGDDVGDLLWRTTPTRAAARARPADWFGEHGTEALVRGGPGDALPEGTWHTVSYRPARTELRYIAGSSYGGDPGDHRRVEVPAQYTTHRWRRRDEPVPLRDLFALHRLTIAGRDLEDVA